MSTSRLPIKVTGKALCSEKKNHILASNVPKNFIMMKGSVLVPRSNARLVRENLVEGGDLICANRVV